MVNPREQVFPDLPPDGGVMVQAMTSPIVLVALVVGTLILAVLAIFAVTGER